MVSEPALGMTAVRLRASIGPVRAASLPRNPGETQAAYRQFSGISRGPENLAFVLLERLDPVGDLSGVFPDAGRYAQFRCHECRCQLGAQFLHGISR
jgi:hypothetical protein